MKKHYQLRGSIFMLKKSKISAEEKLRVVEACLAEKMSIREAGRLVGVARSNVQARISRYQAENPKVLLPTERNRVYSPELKRAAVED
jgi:transposase